MRLPSSHLAIVEQRKIVEYLLNPGHPDNGGKAAYFLATGFSANQWQVLADALRFMAMNFEVAATVETEHGTKYIIEGDITGPVGKSGRTRSIWIIDREASNPRLVTAYPMG
jgi:hypothetical protein